MARSRKKQKRKLCFSKIIALFLMIVSFLLTIEVIAIGIVPTKYILLLIIIMVIINLFMCIVSFKKNIKKKIKIPVVFLSFITTIVFSLGLGYLIKTNGFLNGITASGYKIENYSVIVKKSSNYKKLKDIDGKSLGYYSKTVGASKANKKLSDKIDVTFESYDDATQMAKELINFDSKKDESNKKEKTSGLEVIVVEDSVMSMITEEDPSFEDDIRVIYKFKVKIKVKDNAKNVNVTSKAFNIYISGIDTFGEISSVSRSDVNMVVTVNPKTKQILLTSIPRDYYVTLHTYKAKDKLTHAGMYGVEESIKTIEDFLDIDINYYIKVNFTSVIDVVNAIGGLTVYSDYDFVSEDKFSYTKGYNDMNGEQALSFARERHAFKDGDRQRVKDQQAVLAALIKKLCSKTILTKYSSLLNSLEGEFNTNLSSSKIKSLVRMQLNDMAKWTITSISLDGANSRGTTYSGGSQSLYVMEPNEDTVLEASQLIDEVAKGKKLDGSYEFTGVSNSVKKTTNKNIDSNNTNKTSTSVSPNASCRTGYTLSSDETVCTKVESLNPTYSCSDGTTPVNGNCTKKVGTPTVNCSSSPIDGICPDEDETYSCDVGTISSDKTSCISTVSANITCSSGYTLNGNKCSKTNTQSVNYTCPSGYTLNGKKCVK